MFLAIDIGNSNIVIGVHIDGDWKYKYRYESKDLQPAIFYEQGLRDLFLEWGINPASVANSAISSVVPEITDHIMPAITHFLGFEPLVLGPDVFKKISFEVPKLYEIGPDIVSNAFAVNHIHKQNSIIIDFGTALTFTIYEKDKGIVGVTIAPGLQTIIKTLSGETALLPEIVLGRPKSAIGKSTTTAIEAGVYFGYAGMVKEILSNIQSELDDSYRVIATGGLCNVISDLESLYNAVDKNLTLDGIRQLGMKFNNR